MELFKLYMIVCASWAATVLLLTYIASKLSYGFPFMWGHIVIMTISWVVVTILAPLSVIMLPVSLVKGTYRDSILFLALTMYKLAFAANKKVDIDNLLLTATYAVNADLMSTEDYEAIKAKWDKEQEKNA